MELVLQNSVYLKEIKKRQKAGLEKYGVHYQPILGFQHT